MGMGDVVEWQGKKYVQTGENSRDKASWKPVGEVSSVPSKPFTPGEGGKEEFSLGKLYEVAKRLPTPLGVNTLVSDMLDKAAYNAGGYVTDKASILGASPETSALLGYGANVATQAVPSILSGKAVEAASKPAFQGLGTWLMQKAVKPEKAARESGDAAKAIKTFLEDGTSPVSSGMDKMIKEVRKLTAANADDITAAQSQGTTVPFSGILGVSNQTKAGHFGKQINSADDLAAIDKVLAGVLQDARFAGRSDIPIQVAQDAKTATYKALGSKYGEQGAASVEAQKDIVRYLKEGIEQAVPSVGVRNKRMSELLNAIEVANPGALASGNKNLGGLAYLAENPFAAAGFLMDRSPYLTSILARGAYSGMPSILGAGAAAGTGAYMQ